MTKLEAVNEMLLAIREYPVNSLEAPLAHEASLAVTVLDSVSRTVQSKGWDFNTDLDVTLTKADDDTYTLGTAVVHVEFDQTSYPYTVYPVLLNRRVYDRKNQTFEFTADLKATRLVRIEEWDDLPVSAQQYIAKRAAREFSVKILGSEMVAREAGIEEIQAYRTFMANHNDNSRPNMLSGPTGNHILAKGLLRD